MSEDTELKNLISKLDDDDPQVRLEAANGLVDMGDDAVNLLIDLLKSDDANHRKYATFALKKMGSEKAAKPLIEALQDEDFGVRKFAAHALGDLKCEDAVDTLIETIKDEDWGVRVASTKALGDIGDERAVDPIKKARRAATGDKDFKKVANKALKKIQK